MEVEIVGGTPLKRGPRWWQDIQVIGGLTAVFLGLVVVLFVCVLAMSLVHDDADRVATIATATFTLVGTLVGAFFGIKIGTDQAKTAQEQTKEAVFQMREEAAKAQAFAACLDRDSVAEALKTSRN
jgi:hypothetical protein